MPNKNITLLALSQALTSSGASMLVFVGGITGSQIAPTPVLATLPVSLMIVGAALSTIPTALLLGRTGRRRGYMLGSGLGVLAALLAALAVHAGNFALFCTAALLIGAGMAFVLQYRFGAAESVAEEKSGQAVSTVLLGGIAAGYLGPEIARRTVGLFGLESFSAAFLILAGLYAIAMALQYTLDEIVPRQQTFDQPPRPLRQVVVQRTYLAAVMAGMVGYAVMSFIMTATPLHMHSMQGFSLADTAWVIQSHIIAMYLPSLVTGALIARLGLGRVMAVGVVCLLATVAIALVNPHLLGYWSALVLLGVGWNFLFVSGTVLLTHTYRPAERFKAQAINDFTVSSIQACASLAAGSVLFAANWRTLLLLNLPALLAMSVVIFWSWKQLQNPLDGHTL
jgi:MFS family permease